MRSAHCILLTISALAIGCPIDVLTRDRGVDSSPDSSASDGDASGACPGTSGPAMVALGGTCIDTTEVTARQYAEFLATNPDVTASSESACVAGNQSYVSGVASPADERPIAGVDWCDAHDYCAWAKKRLCRGTYGDVTPATNEWMFACTNGGVTPVPYGDTPLEGICNTNGGVLAPVKSFKACRGRAAPYAAIFDQVGNVREWIDACSSNGRCDALGGSFPYSGNQCSDGIQSEPLRQTREPDIGFRCCADAK